MANEIDTVAGLIVLNDQNALQADINDLLDDAPLLQEVAAIPASAGTQHKYTKTTVAAGSSFRAVSTGRTVVNSTSALVTDTCQILDATFHADVAIANAYRGGKDAFLARALRGAIRAAMFDLESQIINGVAHDSGGFVGLHDDPQLDALSDAMVFNAGGSGVSTQASCYLLRTSPDEVAVVLGNDGRFEFEEDPTTVAIDPANDGATYPAYYVPVLGYAAFQIGGAFSVARIANIEMSDLTSTSAFTDADLYAAISLFPASRQPNLIVMNKQARRLLRQSRTATTTTGASAPLPTEIDGISIVVTDACLATEAVET